MHSKKILALILTLVMVMVLLPAAAFAADGEIIAETTAEEIAETADLKVFVSDWQVKLGEDEPIDVPCYNINGNNYFKLRDFAKLTGIFDVAYENATVTLVYGASYTEDPNNLTGQPVKAVDETLTINVSNNALAILIYGETLKLEVAAYKIDGSNFYRLRDLQAAINAVAIAAISVDIPDDATDHTILLDVEKPPVIEQLPVPPLEGAEKILVAYFSLTEKNTERMAGFISENLEADLYEIVPEEPYATDPAALFSPDARPALEQADKSARPAISSEPELNIDDYDVIFIGYPIWSRLAPRVINTFLESYDFSGKTIVLFCTCGSTPIERSVLEISILYDDYSIYEGIYVTRAELEQMEQLVTAWTDSLKAGS
jgi:flavodoxin